jgi:hypothetical protein
VSANDELDAWSRAAVAAFGELAVSTLGLEDARPEETRPGYPDVGHGAAVPILAAAPMQVGVFGTPEACAAFARALLGMTPDEEMPETDVADALGEIVNIVAGQMKTAMSAGSAKLGTPLFIKGEVDGGTHQDACTTTIAVGTFKADVLMMCEHRNHAHASPQSRAHR